MDTETNRKIIYASLLRYAPESIPLRDRGLSRILLSALIGTTEDKPLRVSQIQSALSFGNHLPSIRPEVIKESLQKLIETGRVKSKEIKKKNYFYLDPDNNDDLFKAFSDANDLFEPVLAHMLQNTEHHLDNGIARKICQSFICHCFARFGSQIAQTVINRLPLDQFMRSSDISAAFEESIVGTNLSTAARESLEVRCHEFLRSNRPDDVQLKFFLSQGYYFAQLIGLEPGVFDPLNESAFSGSVFYLDTNVLIVGLLQNDHIGQVFGELVSVARRLSIELRVTRATIDEARSVAAARVSALNEVIGIIPDDVLRRSGDQFFEAFLQAREKKASLSPEDFFKAFDHLPEVLQERWGISIVEKTADEILAGRDLKHIADLMHETAIITRGWGKSGIILHHDVAHYALVLDERPENPKTWFLTRDRTLTRSAEKLPASNCPFCYSLIGFLQSISPFLITASEEHSFADVFAQLLTEQMFPREQFFDVSELVLLAQMNRDVMTTQREKLIPALDYLKKTVLSGKTYTKERGPEVALCLRTFITSSSDQRELELLEESKRLAAQLKSKETDLEAMRQLREVDLQVVSQQATQIEELDRRNDQLSGQVEGLAESQKHLTLKSARNQMIAGVMGCIMLWLFAGHVVDLIHDRFPDLGATTLWAMRLVLNSIGLLSLALPTAAFLRRRGLSRDTQVIIMTVVMAIGLGVSRFIEPDVVSLWSGLVQLAVVLASLLVIASNYRRNSSE